MSSEPLSPPRSPPKAHESIWKRSKKILGMSRFAFLQQIDAQSTRDKNSKESGEEADSGKPPVSKRREQVRRAQKTHRQRTENYIKALEQEVLRLQKEEAASILERQKRQRAEEYAKILEKQVIQLQKEKSLVFRQSDGLQTDAQIGSPTMTLFDENGKWALKAEMPQYPSYTTLSGISSPSSGPLSAGFSPPQSSSTWANLILINSLANHQTAIDFVLFLEQACMSHIHQPTSDPNALSGHALTASACLIDTAPLVAAPQATWTTSHAEIERLFELSSNLGLAGEITPVQAWNRIWQHPAASRLTADGLAAMEAELKQLVGCYGFGAVIPESDFSAILEKALAK